MKSFAVWATHLVIHLVTMMLLILNRRVKFQLTNTYVFELFTSVLMHASVFHILQLNCPSEFTVNCTVKVLFIAVQTVMLCRKASK